MPTHQRPVYQLHIIRCGAIIASELMWKRLTAEVTSATIHYVVVGVSVTLNKIVTEERLQLQQQHCV